MPCAHLSLEPHLCVLHPAVMAAMATSAAHIPRPTATLDSRLQSQEGCSRVAGCNVLVAPVSRRPDKFLAGSFYPECRAGAGRNVRLRTRSQAEALGASAKGSRTCKNCKQAFDPLENHPRACRFHPAHYGGETKRKFESVYTGGTMSTADGGKVTAYWHCCGNEDPFDLGCEASPHLSYDD